MKATRKDKSRLPDAKALHLSATFSVVEGRFAAMHSLLLLATVIVAAAAQTPPHILFTPQTYHVNTEATFSLTTYARRPFNVTATISYETCTCDFRNRRRCGGGDNVFHEDTKLAIPDQPTLLSVRMPSLRQLERRNYYVSVASHGRDGELEDLVRRRIYFSSNSFGFIMVKSDKPIYKPEQSVNICVVYLDKTLRPHNADADIEVTIRDGKRRQIMKTTITVEEEEGVSCFDMPLSDEPNLGTWNIDAQLKDIEDDGCRAYYSLPRSTCSFRVDEFVLPKFEVTLDGPEQITRADNSIIGVVTSKYTFGENVQGTVKVNGTLEAAGRRESLKFIEYSTRLVNGKAFFNISSDLYRNEVRFRYDPFCVKSSIKLVAEVTEAGREDKQSASITVPLVANPISVSFDDNNPTVFRPGLPYTIKGKASRADGSPATNVTVVLSATANNGKMALLDEEEIVTDGETGAFSWTLDLPQNTKCLTFTLSPSQRVRSCDSQSVCFSPSPMYSPTHSFLQLTDISSTHPLQPSRRALITAEATFPFRTLHIVVVGQGGVQLHRASFDSGSEPVRAINASFPVTHAMVPRAKVLGVVAREDGELVADLIEVEITCDLEHTVGVSFNQREASPGDPISITTETSPNSLVVLGVIDKSLTLLADACKSVEKSNVCDLLRQLTGGSRPSSATCSTDTEDSCCSSTCSEPTKRGVAEMFRAAGVSLTTNMFQPTPPSPPFEPRPFPIPEDIAFFAPEAGRPIPDVAPALPEAPPKEEPAEDTEIRDFFPETWIWRVFKANSSGIVEIPSTVPDTITTWNAEAFAINRHTGLGISPLTELTVKKDLFVSLELPYSVIFGEVVTIKPVVFYFGGKERTVVEVQVILDDDLDMVETNLPGSRLVSVNSGSGTPITMKLRPRAIGRLSITIGIEPMKGYDGISDIVKKPLFVKPGCERFQITENVYASGDGHQCFNYTLPECVIPGSAKATISVTGDIMSPPDLDRLLVLPYGCGEQNLVRTGLNWAVAVYLQNTGQLSDHIAVKIRHNIITGIQRQLTYLQTEGCFSIWANGECSLWLTAFAANAFAQIHGNSHVDLRLPEGTTFVDEAVVTAAFRYIVNQQTESGRFPIIGRLHNSYLMRDDGFIANTAFTLQTLAFASVMLPQQASSLQEPITRSRDYIMEHYNNGTGFCNYGLALSTAALTIGTRPGSLPATVVRMVDDLKSRITYSRIYPGACFLCNSCPDEVEEDQDSNTAECPSRPRGEGSASCVETTAYALQTLVQIRDTELAVCLAQWLVQIKSASGGFYSSQDTIRALVSLHLFAGATFTKTLNKTIDFSLPNLSTSPTTSITPKNRFEQFNVEVPRVPSTDNCVHWTGNGTAIIQSTLEYYGCNCCNDTKTFSLELATREQVGILDTELQLTITVGYLKHGTTNMAIVDVEIPSGYVYTGYREPSVVENNQIQRVDSRGSNVIIYLNEISRSEDITFTVNFVKEFEVEDPHQLPVTVYDYYEPDQIVTKYYLPTTSGTTTPSTPSTPPSNNTPPRPLRPLPRGE